MKKKIIAIAIVCVLMISSVFATDVHTKLVGNDARGVKTTNSKLGVGLSLGYTGIAPSLTYTKNDLNKTFGFRYYLDLGFGWWNPGFALNTGFDWVFVKLIFTDTDSKEAENSILDFAIGAGAHFEVFGKGRVGIGPVGTFSITYSFAENWQVFSRSSFGYGWFFGGGNDPAAGFFWDEIVGFTYQFDLAKDNKR